MNRNNNLQEVNMVDVVRVIKEMTPQLEETGQKIGTFLSDMIDNVVEKIFDNTTNQEKQHRLVLIELWENRLCPKFHKFESGNCYIKKFCSLKFITKNIVVIILGKDKNK